MMKKIGLYIHIPFCKSKCAYCAFNSFCTTKEQQEKYVDALVKEIQLTLNKDIVIDTLYFGGGTPSILSGESIARIVESIKKNATYEPREVTIECNPESVDEAKLDIYKNIGITRISMGVQSLNDAILRLIGRIHTADEAIKKAKLIKSYGFNLSVDMILGLPNSSFDDIENFVYTFAGIGVNHISAYSLSVEPKTRLDKMVQNREVIIPSDDYAIDEYEFAYKLLKKYHYNRYEVSNFAKRGYESQHNNKYWLMNEYIGLGLSSHSYFNGARYYNTSIIDKYIDDINKGVLPHTIDETLTHEDLIEETIMLGLRLEEGIEIARLDALTHGDFLNEYKHNIDKVREYIRIENGRIAIRDEYMNVMNSIIVEIIA